MITYEQAKQKAQKEIPNIDTVIEYDSVYVFYNSKARGAEAEDGEVVIVKDSGKQIPYAQYIMTTNDNNDNKKVRKI